MNQLLTGCGGNLTGSYGTFTSPAYPSPTPNNITCTWLVTTPPRLHPALEFEDFNIANTPGAEQGVCEENYVQVYNGDSESAPLVGTYCGEVRYTPVLNGSFCGLTEVNISHSPNIIKESS